MDHADAAFQGLARALVDDRLASESDRAAVGAVDAGHDLHQGRLAGAILADQGMHLTRAQVEVDVQQGLNARKGLGHAADLEQGCFGGRHWATVRVVR